MTSEPVVQIRTGPQFWLLLLPGAAIFLIVGLLALVADTLVGIVIIALAGVFVGEFFWIRSFGVDLTPEHAVVRGIRRRVVPWDEIEAVVHHQVLGSRQARLVLRTGKHINLRAPATLYGIGETRFWAEFHRLGQWWLAHSAAARHLRGGPPAGQL